VLWDRVVLDDTEARNLFLHMKILPWGCVGGKEGAPGGVWMVAPDSWKVEEKGLLPSRNGISPPEFYRDYAEPLAGYYNPETHEIDHQSGQWYRGLNRVFQLKRDTTVRVISPGGGGWGDPLERDLKLVKRDVRDGYVSLEGAQRDYGVVVKGDPDTDPEALEVDYQATEQLRRSRKEG
jgi:N-methylhydantoinase B